MSITLSPTSSPSSGTGFQEQILQTDIPTRWSGGANLPTVGDTFGNPSYSGVIHTTYTISPTLLNEAAFNYDGNRINMLPLGNYKIPAGLHPEPVFQHSHQCHSGH